MHIFRPALSGFSCAVKKIAGSKGTHNQLHCLYCTNAAAIQSDKIHLRDQVIHFHKAGSGSHHILCLPGALGSGMSDFEPQLKGLGSGGDFTVIAWDPPGYGKSRPPERKFNVNIFHEDAYVAAALMQALGVERYSLLGWSDGGITALILAGTHLSNIQKLVVWGANAYVTLNDLHLLEKVRDIDTWSPKMRAPMENMYGKDHFRSMWNGWVELMGDIFVSCRGDLCKHDLKGISCPTLVVHGSKDPLVPDEHPQFIHKNIPKSRLHVMEGAKHNLHLRQPEEFNALVKEFLLEEKEEDMK
ncbi:unnamed protein product [Darwinula stevensoni]|uniref:AB hydrolase-1 domain-containing protein n=1 Tax=Darwinula stevensoni TaxID=69355 RepID=A0A7R8X714_9CRUS|nr:unnamed protein product [Darwinula stevensoni]CAG0887444.1 unnamed protein product [Darwinula stevensoni]